MREGSVKREAARFQRDMGLGGWVRLGDLMLAWVRTQLVKRQSTKGGGLGRSPVSDPTQVPFPNSNPLSFPALGTFRGTVWDGSWDGLKVQNRSYLPGLGRWDGLNHPRRGCPLLGAPASRQPVRPRLKPLRSLSTDYR